MLLILLTNPLQVRSEVIQLINGDVLNAVVIDKSEGSITINHPALGDLVIDNSRIAAIKTTPQDQTAEESKDTLATAKTADDVIIIDQGLFGTGLLVDWDRNLSVGLSGASGSSNNANFRAEFKTSHETKERRWRYDMYYLLASDNEVQSENRFTANLLRDWFMPETKWFWFSSGGFDWDQFKDWDYRIRWGGGPGYQFIKSDSVELATRQGLNLNYSIFPDRDNEIILEALLGLHWSWQISEKQSIVFDNTLYPALTELGQYRNVTNFEWKHNLDYYNGLAVKFGFHNEYDTTESTRNDLKYYASIVWGL